MANDGVAKHREHEQSVPLKCLCRLLKVNGDVSYVNECFACVCLCASCVPGACGGQKKLLNPRELELQMFVGHCVGPRYQTWS